MISLAINNWKVAADDNATIAQQIDRRRADGVQVCVVIRIDEDNIKILLSTPGCTPSSGPARAPNAAEQRIIDVWNRLRLNTNDFASGDVIAFLHRLSRLLA